MNFALVWHSWEVVGLAESTPMRACLLRIHSPCPLGQHFSV